ncbi:oxygen-independent coproporphyrinogen-III oxidase-like protein [Abditibacteriota bacterium]|nr:oxygen-independent coproporphyrinogen-III oxidase-like protein [Abditibacteriota bacterium]
MSPASLYVHVPFCARRCPYCDFAVSVNGRAEFRAAYLEALQLELKTQLDGVGAHLETIFCGGGTPTELSAAQLNSILQTVRAHATLAPGAEISLEANPENLSRETLRELHEGGWNRLSLGAQSFDDATLRFLGRAHDGACIERVVREAREEGWTNISLDLIYGAPSQTLEVWRETLERAVELRVPHVSAYSLTVEVGTALGQRAAKGTFQALDDDHLADRMDLASEILEKAGLERYEVSNWARPGGECRHNQNYWRGGSYFAAGCGAHGHFDGERFWNERDTKIYVRRVISSGSARVETERLTQHERLIERLATGLRTREGVALDKSEAALLQPTLSSLCKMGLLKFDEAHLKPEKSGFALADGLAARLIGHIL